MLYILICRSFLNIRLYNYMLYNIKYEGKIVRWGVHGRLPIFIILIQGIFMYTLLH